MSDDGREREVTDAAMNEEPRDAGRRDAPPAQVKCFVGGISWHLDDVKLKEGEGGARSRWPCRCHALLVVPGARRLLNPAPSHPTRPPPAAFAEFNPTEAVVMMDKMTGRSRGFGFVMFADKRDQDAAIEKLHNTEVEGRRISVTRAVPQAETAPGTPADALRKGQYVPRDMGRQGGYGGR